ncbi:DJ-1/PfpI family protein [Corynebacterium sp.]|uniref:DJ-1/PfpI family protein n=1 Tax=Corynebacterium sp. TaxID=1720 RepID=UPI001986B700|nr:DJ-1/PfpI family protein [Corynebacterium sp.]HHU66545.1 thiamine biosynthesis protein ThiJ [Corynebacterium sp.]HKM25413.1 DJ-1/PfpI family protein [Corynebacterium sp.]
MTHVVLYAFDSMADWEYGPLAGALGHLRSSGIAVDLIVAGDSTAEVTTFGGLRLRPEYSLSELDPAHIDMLVLPGGNTWHTRHDSVLGLAADRLSRDQPVAAICGATLGLARRGLLDTRRHTSNNAEFLAESGYRGGALYEEARVVVDGPLITAPGTSPLEFTRETLVASGLMNKEAAHAWHQMYTTGDPSWGGRLMAALRG